jgi:hypothetical protein
MAPTAGSSIPPLDVLRALFKAPDRLRPQETLEHVTQQAAREFARLADSLRARGEDPSLAARFLVRILFCLFAEDVGLLPRDLFTRLVAGSVTRPNAFSGRLRELFRTMATGGDFGVEEIKYFNGGLFADDQVLELSAEDLAILSAACRLDWASVEPAIFGTLFERGLDPAKRAQLGAHYTSREDILLIVEPVVVAPLRGRWIEVQQEAQALLDKRKFARGVVRARYGRAAHQLLLGFADELAENRILDPAAGSGNFLYLALRQLLDLEKEAMSFGLVNGLNSWIPKVGPEQLAGIEINLYAHELAQAVVWIGYIQWLRDNGFGQPSPPILKPLVTIQQIDALVAYDEAGRPVEPVWPEAKMIIGNPPFLGGKRLRTELGDKYVDDLFRLYDGRVPREADLVTYWFERARSMIADGRAQRAGLLATNSIRGGANRRVLEQVKLTGDIFLAWSDRPWILDGAAVRVSMIGFDKGEETVRTLDGAPVVEIHPDLTGALNLSDVRRLSENAGLAFMGDTKGGAFDIASDVAAKLLAEPLNPNGRPNGDVVRLWVNGLDVTRRPRSMWIIDFGVTMPEPEAALYELPYQQVLEHVKPERARNSRVAYRNRWWLHVESRPAMRSALAPLRRFIGTPTVAKYRLFVWLEHPTLPDHQLIVVAREDDYFFGVLHSKLHEVWALRMGTALEDRPRYTPTTTFETFPFPWPPGQEPAGDSQMEAIAEATRALVQKRDAWLNPPGADEAVLKTRTLTKLYNTRPTWLGLAHEALDRAVLDAYRWPHDLSDAELLERLFARNRERAAAEMAAGGQLGLPEPAVVGMERFHRGRKAKPETEPAPPGPRVQRRRRRPA